METFTFGEALYHHKVGDVDCDECWYEPHPCTCGGLVHQQFLDEDWDNVILSRACDKCNDAYDEIGRDG